MSSLGLVVKSESENEDIPPFEKPRRVGQPPMRSGWCSAWDNESSHAGSGMDTKRNSYYCGNRCYGSMSIKKMNDTSSFVDSGVIDGSRFISGSAFRSPRFLVLTALGFAVLVVDLIILYLNRRAEHAASLVVIGGLVAVQLLHQWWGILRYYSRIRSLYAAAKLEGEVREGSPLDLAVRIAAGGLADILFYGYGIALILLILVGLLARHLG